MVRIYLRRTSSLRSDDWNHSIRASAWADAFFIGGHMLIWYESKDKLFDDISYAMERDEDFTLTPHSAQVLMNGTKMEIEYDNERMKSHAREAASIIGDFQYTLDRVRSLIHKCRTKQDKADIEEEMNGLDNDIEYVLEQLQMCY